MPISRDERAARGRFGGLTASRLPNDPELIAARAVVESRTRERQLHTALAAYGLAEPQQEQVLALVDQLGGATS